MAVVSKSEIARVGEPKHSKLQGITREKLKRHLPKGSGHEVTDRVLGIIQRMEDETGLDQGYLEEQLLTHTSVFKDGKIKLEDYINAIKYCTLVGNLNNRKAWEIVFPERLERLEARIEAEAEKAARGEKSVMIKIDAHVSNYNTTPLVVEIRSRMAVAFDVLYAPLRVEALMKNRQLMNGVAAPTPDGEMMVVTPTVQQAAAATILSELKPAADNKLELKIGMSEEAVEAQNNLADSIRQMALQQQEQRKQGIDLREVQKIGITTVDVGVE